MCKNSVNKDLLRYQIGISTVRKIAPRVGQIGAVGPILLNNFYNSNFDT